MRDTGEFHTVRAASHDGRIKSASEWIGCFPRSPKEKKGKKRKRCQISFFRFCVAAAIDDVKPSRDERYVARASPYRASPHPPLPRAHPGSSVRRGGRVTHRQMPLPLLLLLLLGQQLEIHKGSSSSRRLGSPNRVAPIRGGGGGDIHWARLVLLRLSHRRRLSSECTIRLVDPRRRPSGVSVKRASTRGAEAVEDTSKSKRARARVSSSSARGSERVPRQLFACVDAPVFFFFPPPSGAGAKATRGACARVRSATSQHARPSDDERDVRGRRWDVCGSSTYRVVRATREVRAGEEMG